MPVTRVRTMTGVGIDKTTHTYTLPTADAVVAAYAADKSGGVATGMPTFEAALAEGRSLVTESRTRAGVYHIILPDSRAWFGFPEET